MPALSAVFLVAALILAVVIGPQTRSWTWGPAMLALGMSVLVAVPAIWKRGKFPADFGLISCGALVAGWFGWRAWTSPVAELGQADLLLLAGAVATVVSIRAIEGNALAERILAWGIALLLLANVVVIGQQVAEPSFSPVFRSRAAAFPSGFYAQYNEAANYLIASSLLVAAAAAFGRHRAATRVIWGLIALGGLAAVYFTRSRGGILGAAVGGGVFAAAALMIGQREKSKWFAPALVAIPLIGLAIGGFLLSGWQDSQELRRAGSGIEQLMDNNCRLYFLGIAASCFGLHPLAGGGSRSFSWECFRFFENKLQGESIAARPEQVHNELLQAATDYGLIGAGLLIGLLGSLAVVAVVRILFSESSREFPSGNAWRLGGLAALAGMFVQSCFSFVFHLLPGVLLLGICLGQMSRASAKRGKVPSRIGPKILLSAAAFACALLMIPLGWQGTQVTRALWPSHFSKSENPTDASKIDALSEAIQRWPQATFYQDRAALFQKSQESAKLAIDDYEQAERLHPFDPGPAVNRANLLSQQQQDAAAEAAYERAIRLQGGMEPAFRAHFSFSNHLMIKGLRQLSGGDSAPALASLEAAAQQLEESVRKMHWITPDMRATRVSVHDGLGTAREANGDPQGALRAYDFAATLPNGSKSHYRAGILVGKMAASTWADHRPAEALGGFIEAKRRVGLAQELPPGITPNQRDTYLAYLNQNIELLKAAKIEPLPLTGK